MRISDWSSDVCSSDLPRPRLPGDVGIRCADATRLPRWLKSRPKHHPLPHPETPMALPDSVLDTLGDTPIIKLQRLPPKHVTLSAKVASFNPGGSVKDRMALAMVLDAEPQSALKPERKK